MKMIKHILMMYCMLAIAGCVTTRSVRDTTIADFTSSGSPCYDALLVNVYAAGCTQLSQQNITDPVVGKRISCTVYHDDSDPSTGWLVKEFYAFRPPLSSELSAMNIQPLCFDPTMAVFWSERD